MSQTAVQDYNNHILLNGVDSYIFDINSFDMTGKSAIFYITPYDFTSIQTVHQNSISSTKRFGVGINGNTIRAVVYNGAYKSAKFNISSYPVGTTFKVEVSVTDYSTAPIMTVNGLPSSGTGAIQIGSSKMGFGARIVTTPGFFFNGVVTAIIDGVSYDYTNAYNGSSFVGNKEIIIIPEDPNNTGFDLFGCTIKRPLLSNGLNFGGQKNHHVDIGAVVPNNPDWTGTGTAGILKRNHILGDTDYVFFKLMTEDGGQVILADDVFAIIVDTANEILVSYKGVTYSTGQIVVSGQWYFIANTTTAAGAREVYLGTDSAPPTLLGSDAVGATIAATSSMKLGNLNPPTSDSENGYLTQFVHYTHFHILAEVTDVWNAVKSKAIDIPPPPPFKIVVTSSDQPLFTVVGATVTSKYNGDGTWNLEGGTGVTSFKFTGGNITGIDCISADSLTSLNGMCDDLFSLATFSSQIGFDTSSVTDMSQMFNICESLTSIDLSSFDTSSVTDMSQMFNECGALTSIDLSSFDTSSVTDMSQMFNICDVLTSIDVSNFNTSSVINMSQMFNNCGVLTSIDLSSFDTSSVTDMSYMFQACDVLTSIDLSSFDTSSVINMSQMFNECFALTSIDLSSFDTSSVTDMSYMFDNCSALTCITNIDSTAATNTTNMFGNTPTLISPNAADQALILAGYNWVNPNPCP